MQRSTPFEIKLHGEPIQGIEPLEAISTGISSIIRIPGIIHVFEEHSARINAGYTLDRWEALVYGDRVFEVALNRMRDIIELHKADAMALETKRGSKSGAKR